MTNSQLTVNWQPAHCWPKNNKQLANSFPNLSQIVLADGCFTVGHLSVICWQSVDVNTFFFETLNYSFKLLQHIELLIVCQWTVCQQSTDRRQTDLWVIFTTQNKPAAGNFAGSNGILFWYLLTVKFNNVKQKSNKLKPFAACYSSLSCWLLQNILTGLQNWANFLFSSPTTVKLRSILMTYLEPGTSGDVNLNITQKNDNQSTAD